MRTRLNLSPEEVKVERILIEEARAMTGAQKIQRACELTEAYRAQVRADLRRRYPHASEYELRMRFGVEMLGPELTKKAYGWEHPPKDS